MKIIVSREKEDLVSLEDSENFDSFGVFIDDNTHEIDEAFFMTEFAWPISSKEVWVRISEIRRLVSEDTLSRGWDIQFSQMITYASSKQWLSDDGYFIKAHIVRTPSSKGV